MLNNRQTQGCGLAALGLLVAALGMVPMRSLEAGVIFVPGQLVDNKYVPPKAEPKEANQTQPAADGFGYAIRYSRVTAEVTENKASIKAAETVSGPKAETETVCIVPLPVGTSASDARLL
ncbi:MAG: hypothetical protein KDA84_30845, partial [Planctomycetaceae bacterium]|nr:hypothetical protein [Planctomycetaceae bacterium]